MLEAFSTAYNTLTEEQISRIPEDSGILHFAAKAKRLDILKMFTNPDGAFKYDPARLNADGATALEIARGHGNEFKIWADKFGALLGRQVPPSAARHAVSAATGA